MSARDHLAELRIADLITFLTVRQLGSVSAAARELRVTPSQVSKAIARLEGHLHGKLLVRGARGTQVSDLGRRIAPEIEQLVERVRQLDSHHRGSASELTIGAPSYLNAAIVPRFAAAHRDLRVSGLDLAPDLVRAYTTENVFDVGLILGDARLPESWVVTAAGFLRRALFTTPKRKKQLGRGPVEEAALRDIPFVSPVYYGQGRFNAIDDDCPLKYGQRRLGSSTQTIGLALEIAAASDQLVFGPVIAARRHLDAGTLLEIPVAGWDTRVPLSVACNADRLRGPMLRATVELVKETLNQLDTRAVDEPTV